MIRRAGDADWPTIRDRGIAFNEAHFHVPVAEHRLRGWFDQHMKHGCVFMSPAGYISALLLADPIRDWTAVVETAWYDPGRHGLRLLDHLIEYARIVGADEVRMTTLDTTPAGVDRLLTRRGFRLIEKSYSRVL